jgi:hypothetical protein
MEPDTLRRALRGLFYSTERESVALAQEAQAAAEIAKAFAALGAEPGAPGEEQQTASSTATRIQRVSTQGMRAATSRPIEEHGGG